MVTDFVRYFDYTLNMNSDDWRILATVRCVPGIGRRSVRGLYQALVKNQIKPKAISVGSEHLVQKKLLSQKQRESIISNYSEQKKCLELTLSLFREIRLINIQDGEYPPQLLHSDDPPIQLYAMGPVVDWQEAVVVAIVGARNMSQYGEFATKKIASELSTLGVIVVSGLMYGVDTTAHLATLEAGGQTVAVLGYGFQQCYPEEHRPALQRVLALGGTLYSEYPPWQPAVAGQFPARNTIVAGMCHGVLVTEAAEQSGTMITVQSALDNGRHIFAVPGPIDNPYTSGTRYLLNQGATLVASGQDVLSYLAGLG